MAITLVSQKDLRNAQDQRFCYLCGEPLLGGQEVDRDHVPPTGLFLNVDRDPPLILPTHRACNGHRKVEDQQVKQLVGLLHGHPPDRGSRLKFSKGQFKSGSGGVAVEGIDLNWIVWRWVRGFHAALYGEWLPESAERFVCPPLPEAELLDGTVVLKRLPDVLESLVKELRKNRAAQTVDRVLSRGDRCLYDCVWAQYDDGRRFCVWALDIYSWAKLGDTKNFEPRGCVGWYQRPGGGTPAGASTASRLVLPSQGRRRLDPFADESQY